MSSLFDADNLEADPSNSNEIETVNGVNGTSTEKPKSPNKKSDEVNNGSAHEAFDDIVSEEEAERSTLEEVIEKMLIRQHDSINYDEYLINLKCKLLFEKDYIVEVVENTDVSHYPRNIIVPLGKKKKYEERNEDKKIKNNGEEEIKSQKNSETEIPDLMEFDKETYSQLVKESLIARLRSRFVAPVILFDNKFICRSATLTVWTSALYEKLKPSMPSLGSMFSFGAVAKGIASGISTVVNVFTSPTKLSNALSELYYAAREHAKLLTGSRKEKTCVLTYPVVGQIAYTMGTYIDLSELYAKDVKVLEYLKIERIFDLMVEYNKNYRNVVNVSSTEKVNALYDNFKVEGMPYPGCEFFELYNAFEYSPDDLLFDWKQRDVKRTLTLTKSFQGLDIEHFKSWDIMELTLNYLQIMLSYLVEGTGGMVVHCISGWDRTPLFISLIRVSLWADGLIHESLDVKEMAYLTVAYDWFLFGHNLPDRREKKEEIPYRAAQKFKTHFHLMEMAEGRTIMLRIMHFFLGVTAWMYKDKFSATRMFHKLPTELKRNRTFPEFVPKRRKELLEKMREIFKVCADRIRAIPRTDSSSSSGV